MTAYDTLRLRAVALDAAGKPVDGVTYKFVPAGGRFEGKVDTTGLIQSGSTGNLGVSVIATVPGTKPVVEKVDVRMVPGPVASVVVRARRGPHGRGPAPPHERLELLGGNGRAQQDKITWRSSAPAVARVGEDGVVTAVAPGKAVISAKTGTVEQKVTVQVIANTLASVELTPASSDVRTGDVIDFKVTARDRNGAVITGLTPTWSFSPGNGAIDANGAFVGYVAGDYLVTASFGAKSVDAAVTLKPRDVRRPVTVVGRLGRTRFTTEEVWVMPDGKHAFLGSGSGGDVLYAIDISDPANPTVTDSIISNTRRVNDVMSTPDGKVIVFTREGASDRKNGIVIASTEDPAHPKVISEFTEGVNSGVHSAFVYQQEKYGTFVFLTNDGTGAMHVIDINDPYQAEGSGPVAHDASRRRPHAARHRHPGRTRVPELLE